MDGHILLNIAHGSLRKIGVTTRIAPTSRIMVGGELRWQNVGGLVSQLFSTKWVLGQADIIR